MPEINGDIVNKEQRNYFKNTSSVFVVGFGMYLVYNYVHYMNTNIFKYYYDPNQQAELTSANFFGIFIFFLFSFFPLKLLPIKKWWDGIQEIGMFLFILPSGIGFFLSYLIELYNSTHVPSINTYFMWATFALPFILSYIKIITIFKTRKK